ncbi:Major facilitator superfamily domain-containing protein 6 [Exaiptasia diaphana]|nr:Major facilitator superfamily domain-containing protein 6 [Exaiptasia diaphana]
MAEDKEPIIDDQHEGNTKKDKKCCPNVNRTLLVPKGFYFFFFSAWGSLLPYLALYFKQLMLSPSEVGILMGLKPFVNFLVIPIWGAIVDKCHKSKLVLIISMIALISTTFSLSLVPAPKERKIVVRRMCNMTGVSHPNFIHRPVLDNPDDEIMEPGEIDKMVDFEKDKYLPYFYKEPSPWPLEVITNLEQRTTEIVRREFDTTKAFITLFLITFCGTLFSAPTLALVDTATIQLLGTETYKYGMQRLTGSVGWGVVATRFHFDESERTSRAGGLRVGLRALKSPKYIMFLFTALYLGFLMAFIKTFLFWHLKDKGGSQLLFSIISAVNCFAEVSMYFLSARLIKKIGHAKVLYLGLICYAIRLFYYSAIPNPWMVLAVELLPGITTAAVWAACLSYVSINSGPGAATTMQCILHGVHWGLGYGAGEVIGGIMVHHYGAPFTFVFFGVVCLIMLAMYMFINNVFGSKDDKDIGGCKEVGMESEEDIAETKQKD